MAIGDRQEALEEFSRFRAAANGEEIDQLNQQAGAAAAGTPHRLDQAAQPGQEAIMADAKERPARYVADAGRLDHNRTRHAAGEALIPLDDFVGDVALLGRSPWHHGGNPGPLGERNGTDIDRRK